MSIYATCENCFCAVEIGREEDHDCTHGTKEQSELEKLKAENARLRSALEFYADEKNWNDDNVICTYDVIDESDRSIPEGCCDYRGGKRAREALNGGSSE